MEWTREQRYTPYNKWDAETLLKLQTQAATSPYQMHYHVHPLSGLMNDPNGFSYFNGEYHLFTQSYPFGPVHGLKSWAQFASDDLVHWHYLGQAIFPDSDLDNAGAYSGSAMEKDGKLLLMYTGNHRDPDWTRIPYQIIAEMDEDEHITKPDKPAILPPDHVSEHFRDPQLIRHNGKYFVLIGAQDKVTKEGKIDVFESSDLNNWQEVGYLDFSKQKMGYMIECPNIVWVNKKPILIFCPQGLEKDVAPYSNIYPNMYLVGDNVDLEQGKFDTQQPLLNFDDGFDVYATQAFNAPNGEAYAIGWVGLPDLSYPSDKENWANVYTQVRRLEVKHNHLYQHPVESIKELRYNEKKLIDTPILTDKTSQQYELKLHIDKNQTSTLFLNADNNLKHGLQINFNTGKDANLIVNRGHLKEAVNPEYGIERSINLPDNQALDLDIFIDGSLAEVFVNDGRHVLTLRFFADKKDQKIAFSKSTKYAGHLWKMHSIL